MSYAVTHRRLSFSFVSSIAVLVALWLAGIVTLGAAGTFATELGRPPTATLAAMLLPPLMFGLMLKSRSIREQVLAIDPVWLVAVQGLRILGAGFLVAYAYGHLPALFAHAAGWGDVLVALLAPFVAVKLARSEAFLGSPWLTGFHALGLLDFVGAVVTGLLSRGTLPFLGLRESTEALSSFPLLLIPCFAVPLWICLHMAALLQISEFKKGRARGR